MNRPNRFSIFALLAIAALAGAFGYAFFAIDRVRDSQRAEIAMRDSVNSVRRLQTSIRALQNERARISAVREDWIAARTEFGKSLASLHAPLTALGSDLPHLSRMAHTWSRMEELHRDVDATLARLESSHALAHAGTNSLTLLYGELLLRTDVPDREIGQLGQVLFELEQADRLVNEVEAEMRDLMGMLHQRTQRETRESLAAAVAVCAVAGLLVLFLLYRMARLYTAVQADNAARRVAEQTARASEADLAITLDAIGEAVVATDTEGRVLRLNPAATQLLGAKVTASLGRPVRELARFLDPARGTESGHPVDAVLTTGKLFAPAGHLRLVRPDGAEREVGVVASPIVDEAGRLRGTVLALRDLTEHRQLEEQLRHAQRVESLGKLAGGVAHDFNNILQVVRANAGMLALDQTLAPDSRTLVHQIDEASGRAADLTRQLLALGRRQTLQVRELDPGALVRGLLKLAGRVIGETIEISYHASADHDWVRADPGQLEQVLLNLCVNARDAMPRGGRLSLTLENSVVVPGQRAGDWARPGKFVRFAVSDTGSGMSAETLAHLFEPFFTTKEIGKGTGLGLSVVQGIVHQHGGFLDVRSTLGEGTCIFVYLPRCDRPPAEPPVATGAAPVETPTAQGETVLLVEDDASVRRIAELVLRRQGYRVLVAGDGEEGCRVGEKHRAEIAAAVLDVVMPRLGGPDAARLLQKTIPGLPIILCTGYAGGIEVPELNDGTGWELLHKPYSTEALATVVRHAIDTRREAKR